MNKKKTYIASRVEIVNMCSSDNIATVYRYVKDNWRGRRRGKTKLFL